MRNARQQFKFQNAVVVVAPQDNIPVLRQAGDNPVAFLLEIAAQKGVIFKNMGRFAALGNSGPKCDVCQPRPDSPGGKVAVGVHQPFIDNGLAVQKFTVQTGHPFKTRDMRVGF